MHPFKKTIPACGVMFGLLLAGLTTPAADA
jgi:hypothetical protein